MLRKSSVALLDRLCDAETEGSLSLEHLSENIRINVENLLNTRRSFLSFGSYKQLEQSIVNYGIDDFSGMWLDSLRSYDQFAEQVQRAIVLFEPRLKNISVSLQEELDPLVRRLKLRIEAELQGEIANQSVTYQANVTATDTFLSLKTGRVLEVANV